MKTKQSSDHLNHTKGFLILKDGIFILNHLALNHFQHLHPFSYEISLLGMGLGVWGAEVGGGGEMAWWNCAIYPSMAPGSAFIKPDQRNPWIKDQIKITLLPTISHLLLPNFVSCGRACPSHMTQNLVTVGAKLWTADRFIVDPWSMDYADPVW